MAEFGGSKAWSIQSSPLIYHLLQRTVDSFAEDRVKAWWVASATHQSGWGQKLLSWRSIFPSVMLQWAVLMGRAGRGEPQSLSLHSLEQPHTQTLVSGKPVTVTMRCNVDCSTIAPVTKNQEQQKTPEFPSCALAENHTVFPSAFQLCRSSAQTTGIKGERVSSRPLLLLLCSTWLSLRSAWKAHSRSSPPGRQETVSQDSCFVVCLLSPSENIQKLHTPPLFYLLSAMIFSFNRYGSANKKFKTLTLHLQSRFWVFEVLAVNVVKILLAAMNAGNLFSPFE